MLRWIGTGDICLVLPVSLSVSSAISCRTRAVPQYIELLLLRTFWHLHFVPEIRHNTRNSSTQKLELVVLITWTLTFHNKNRSLYKNGTIQGPAVYTLQANMLQMYVNINMASHWVLEKWKGSFVKWRNKIVSRSHRSLKTLCLANAGTLHIPGLLCLSDAAAALMASAWRFLDRWWWW